VSDWIVRLIEQSGYLGIGFLMFLETVFPPIPSEVIMPIAGVAAGQGKLHFGTAVAAGTAGARSRAIRTCADRRAASTPIRTC
jgi:membrane protein DedA with SNARE-associated domain